MVKKNPLAETMERVKFEVSQEMGIVREDKNNNEKKNIKKS